VEHTLDISSDLTELGRTPVAVVCAGAKSILDIPRTLEYLETLGVLVFAYQTDHFPAFFSRSSGCPAQARIDTPQQVPSPHLPRAPPAPPSPPPRVTVARQVAEVLVARGRLGLAGGAVIGVPVPEGLAAAGEDMEAATRQVGGGGGGARGSLSVGLGGWVGGWLGGWLAGWVGGWLGCKGWASGWVVGRGGEVGAGAACGWAG
jgi:hypothetical protein